MEVFTYIVYYGDDIRNLSEWEVEAISAGQAKTKFREKFGFNYIKIQKVELKK